MCGGNGSRLYPLTKTMNKHLLPVFNKPMVYYSLGNLIYLGFTEIVIVVRRSDLQVFADLLGDGSRFGIDLKYEVQDTPGGILEGVLIGQKSFPGSSFCLALGDNLFFGNSFRDEFLCALREGCSFVVLSHVQNVTHYGAARIDLDGHLTSIVEKPATSEAGYAVTGLYYYQPHDLCFVDGVKPSERGELEITDFNNAIIEHSSLRPLKLGRGVAWFDMGRPQTFMAAANLVQTLEERMGVSLGCLEEISIRHGLISKSSSLECIRDYLETPYGRYLREL